MQNSGPQGVYDLKASISGALETKIVKVMLSSPAYNIKILDGLAKMKKVMNGVVGQPLPAMPTVAVYDSDGNPLKDKYVIAFSWPEPIFNPESPSFAFVDGLKLAFFNNSVSPPTNEEGITQFENLTVLGYTYKYGTYLHFAVDGAVAVPYIEDLGSPKRLTMPPKLFKPLILSTETAKVEVVVRPPEYAYEGKPFPIQPIIRILDKNGNPLANKLVFAVKVGGKGQAFASNYAMDYFGVMKDLVYPIPGNYSENFTNPIKSADYVPKFTNETGYVQFDKLGFNSFGITGNSSLGLNEIVFICDGVTSEKITVKVLSIVSKIEFVEAPPTTVVVDPYAEIHLTLVLRILSEDGIPIEGKVPTSVEIATKLEGDSGRLRGYVATWAESYKASGKDGIFVLPYGISIMRIPEDMMNAEEYNIIASLKIQVDDTVIMSPDIEFSADPQAGDGEGCFYVEVENAKNNIVDVVFLCTLTNRK